MAGPTLAYWLTRHGFTPTVVERSTAPRSSGNPVDVRGPALPVAEKMGLLPRLRDAATNVESMSFVDAAGRRIARLPMSATRSGASDQEVEIPRADLAAILYEAARDTAEFVFDDSIAQMRQDEGGVDVTFERSAPRRFDLVIGADGLHSTVRRLAFGRDAEFVRHMGVYVATMPLGAGADNPREVLLYNTPGRLASIHPSRGNALAAFIFRGPAIADLDHRDTKRHKEIVTAAYSGGGWRLAQLLETLRATDDLYFDSVSKVRLATWSRGRIALLGDAASCVSLLGEGSSLAMAGAFTLAASLGADPGDHSRALRHYEATHRRLVNPRQRGIGVAAGVLIPKTRLGLAVRNLGVRAWASWRA
ncbi:oxidoreductase [Rhizocola hellebori]|uniref:Oxidoreductase n=1 Tax=Rhizocola hellebori TaxID=1392758 RepID=A0A8J3QEW3_9ACTN|nr:oxidoreductase [Rhizocola hellebori]